MEIVKCACGKEAEVEARQVETGGKIYYAQCVEVVCWKGPACKTEREAVAKWNSIMGLVTLFYKSVLCSLYGKFGEPAGS